MTTETKLNCSIGLGVAALVAAIVAASKLGKAANKLDMSADEVMKRSHIDISQQIVDSATKDAATRKAREMAINVASNIEQEIHKDIHAEVVRAVSDSYNNIKRDVVAEIERKVGAISVEDARKEVINKAKERAAEKFNSDLNDILEKYNGELANVSKIYSSIAQSMTGTNTGKITLGF